MADPVSLTLMAVGTAVSAAGTIAGGANAASLGTSQQNESNYQAAQLTENASSEIAASQRTMLDTQQKTRLALGKVTADAAGGGFVATSGTPEAISGSIARRGSYEAAMNLFQGQNQSTGDLNRAAGLRESGAIAAEGGQMQQEAADFSAVGNIATAGGKMYAMGNGVGGTPGTMNVGGNSYVAYG